MSTLDNLVKFAGKPSRVVLCESFDQRILRVAHTLNQQRWAEVVLLGNADQLLRAAGGYLLDVEGMEIVDIDRAKTQEAIREDLDRLSLDLDPTDPVVAGAWLVRNGRADAVVAGAATTPAHVMQVYLQLLGIAEGSKNMSGMSLVAFEKGSSVRSQAVGLADVSVVPEPTVEQLADIAVQSALTFQRITGAQARVAFLSFSTMGSSDHPAARRIRKAVELVRSSRPDLAVDGEMQIDAALVPAIASAKCPSSSVAGSANVLIFPSLAAGNIAEKTFKNFSTNRVIGPILQGTAYRATYIPRASSAEDILDQVRLLVC